MLEREYQIPPCKVLYSRETGFAPDAPPEVVARPLEVPYAPEPKRDVVGVLRHDRPRRLDPPPVISREVPEKRRKEVTIEAIRKLRAEGKNVKQIAAELRCTGNLIYRRMELAGDKPDRKQLHPVPPGAIYGWLEVIGQSRSHATQGRIFVCWCKCGALTEAPYKALNNGTRTSCGCKKPTKLAQNPERVKLAASLWRKHGLSEAARRMGCSRTGIYRLLVAGGVKWKESDSTSK